MIACEKITKVYGQQIKTQVLFDVDLQIERGSFNAIIGESGSGKSTLLNILGTLDRQTSGTVLFEGQDISKMTANELAILRNDKIGFIFQFHYLLPEFTAYENILMPSRIKNGKVSKEVKNRADELIELVGLSKVKNNLAGNMSGGQQQRTAIARALMNQPSLILADEPTGNLDSGTTESVYALMREINQNMGTTFVTITHDRRIAERADRIIEVSDGRIIQDNTTRIRALA